MNSNKSLKTDFDVFSQAFNKLLMYVDYWIEDGRLYPVAAQVYNLTDKTHDVCIYHLSTDVQKHILNFYKYVRNIPYWVKYIGDDQYVLDIALNAHFQQEGTSIVPDQVLNRLLQGKEVVLITAFGGHTEIANHYQIQPNHVLRINHNLVADSDFLPKLSTRPEFQEVDSVIFNNQLQAIASLHTNILRIKKKYPKIIDMHMFNALGDLFHKRDEEKDN